MSAIKRYTVSYDDRFDMVVEIDHDILTDAKLHEINDFWSDAEDRVRDERGNITKVVLKLLAARAFVLTLTSFDAIKAFSGKNGQEGWPAMDGSEGIKIVRIDEVVFEASDLDVTEG